MGEAIYMGMMSGTSMDAVDAVLVTFPDDHSVQLLASISRPWPEDLRQSLFELCRPGAQELYRMARLDRDCGDFFAATAQELLRQHGIAGHLLADRLRLGNPCNGLDGNACRQHGGLT